MRQRAAVVAAAVAILAAACALWASAAWARPIPVRYEECRLVFSGRDTLGEPVIAAMLLACGTGPTGGTVREYRGWIGRGAAWEPLFDRKWVGASPPDDDLAGIFPAEHGVMVRGQTEPAGPFHRPRILEIAWRDELRAIALVTERLEPDFQPLLDREPSDLYRSADPASFRRVRGVSRATLTVGFEKMEGQVFHEFVACLGSSPYLDEPEAPGHFGDYDRALLWDETGSFWLVEAGSREAAVITGAEAVAAGEGRRRVKTAVEEASLTRLGAAPLPQARRRIPDAWRLEIPAWGFEASVRARAQSLDVGDAGPHGQRPVHARFHVAGQASVRGETRMVFGIVEHIQD